MRIAISTEGNYVAAHFGRCPVFTIIDTDGNEIISKTTLENPGHAPGVIPRFLKDNGADMIICGGMGVRALEIFKSFGIITVMGIDKSIEETIQNIKDDTLTPGKSMCRHGSGKGHGVEKTQCDHEEGNKEC